MNALRNGKPRNQSSHLDKVQFPYSTDLFNTLPIGIVFQNKLGQIITANPAAEHILGLSFDQMRGVQSVDPRWHAIHEDGTPWPGEEHPAMVALRTAQPVRDVVMGVYSPKLDKHTWILVSAFPIQNGLLQGVYALFEDISERKLAQAIEKESSERFHSLFVSMSEGMAVHQVIYDDKGQPIDYLILDVNPAFETQTGLSRLAVVGALASQAYGSEPAPFLDIYAAVAHSKQSIKFDQYFAPLNKHFLINVFSPADDQFVTVFEDITDRKLAEERIRHLAFYDVLTNLPNRSMLNDRLNRALALSKRTGRYGAVMFMDLDNFKPLNDQHGHDVGDLLLIEVSQRLLNSVREMDTVARFGGDEFVVILGELEKNKVEATSHAQKVAEKILTTLSKPYELTVPDGIGEALISHRCSASIGVVMFCNHIYSKEDILKWADMAMYQAKEAGRNVVRFFDPD